LSLNAEERKKENLFHPLSWINKLDIITYRRLSICIGKKTPQHRISGAEVLRYLG